MGAEITPTVLVHGGAGLWNDERIPPAVQGCEEAAAAGSGMLRKGALEAACAAVKVLEQNPVFNAGLGASLTRDGTVELDAAVMTGDLSFGAVASCPPVESAIELARRVLEDPEHSLLSGEGAVAFATEHGVKILGSDDLTTPARVEQLERVKALRAEGKHVFGSGTVGAVAVDESGVVAAATSTGGIVYKRRGRVGDTPLIGAGTYADEEAGGAASATGHGEAILRVLLCREAVERLRNEPVADAGAHALEILDRRVAGKAGLILIDKAGDYFAGKNTRFMPWAAAGIDGPLASGS